MNLSKYKENYTIRQILLRKIWFLVNKTIFRCLVTSFCRIPRILLLRLFGAKIPICSLVYSSSEIWAPWYLTMGEFSCIGPKTIIYNKAPVIIGDHSVVSQGAFLCTASHDITSSRHSLICDSITISDQVWVAADAFIGMGVNIGQGAVVGARAAVFKDVAPWSVVGGNPAKFIKERKIHE